MNRKNILLLIRKDFISVFHTYGFWWFYMLFVFVSIGFMPSMIPFMFVLIVYVLVVSQFQNEENDLVCNVTAILPIRKRDAVIARYLYLYLVMASVALFALIIGAAGNLLRSQAEGVVYPISAGVISVLMMCSINIPLIYRFGVVKTRIVISLIFMVMIIATSVASGFFMDAVTEAGGISLVVGLGGAVVFSLLSLLISIRIQR